MFYGKMVTRDNSQRFFDVSTRGSVIPYSLSSLCQHLERFSTGGMIIIVKFAMPVDNNSSNNNNDFHRVYECSPNILCVCVR